MKLITVTRNPKKILRIIPHHTVLNSANRRIWYSLHDLLTIYDSPLSRISREGWTFTYQVRDDIWWVVIMKAVEDTDVEGNPATKRQIEFYVCLPSSFSEVFITKLKNHEQWKRCTIQEAPPESLEFPPGDIDLYKLKYTRANIFSLSHDYTQQTSPVRSILQVSQEMYPGDFAGLFTRVEAVSRRRWKALADYAWEVWDRKSVPQRADLDLSKLFNQLRRVGLQLAGEAKSLIDDVMLAMERSFFSGKDGQSRKLALDIEDPERAELLVNGSLSNQSKHKRNLPAYKTSIQLVVGAETIARRNMLAYSLSSAFSDLHGDNRLTPLKLNIKYTSGIRNLEAPRHDRDPNILSTDELGKVTQLPTRELQEEFKEALESNQKIEVEVPKVFLPPSGIYMGNATDRGKALDVYLPTADLDMLMTSRAFLGSPRMGKDQAAINLVVESKRKHGIGAVIPDVIDERNGHRGMADAIRDHLPPEDVIDLNLGDFDWPPYIGLGGIVNTTNERIAGNRIAQELTSFLMGEDIENHQTREYLREAAKATAGNLMGIRMMLTSKSYRELKITELRGKGRDTALWDDYHQMSEGRQGQLYGPIMVRLGELMGDEALRPIFCQDPNPAMNLEKWMREGKVVIYRIPNRDLGEMATRTLVHWIVMVTFLTKLSMGGGACTWLVLNEPHQYLSPGLVHFSKRLLVEGPKYRIAPIFMFHHFKLLPNDFVDILLSSSLNWHLFKNTNNNVYTKLASYLEPTFTPELAMSGTKKWQYIAAWLAPSGEYQTPFIINTPDLVGKRYPSQDNSFLTKRHSRQYGRHILDIEKSLQAKQKMYR